jgi:hypothetical protein
MNNKKILSLTKYAEQMKDRLSSPVPNKWKHAPEAYRNFLSRELKLTLSKIDDLKLREDMSLGSKK